MSTQRIAITGASGLVGTALVEHLQSPQTEFVYLQRPEASPASQRASMELEDSQRVDWSPSQGVTDVSKLEGLDAFIHLAGRSISAARWTIAEKVRLRESRVLATQRLAQQVAALDRKPEVFICASAVGFYGDCGSNWVTESDPPGEDFLGNLAFEWESATEPLVSAGIRVVKARLGIVMSPKGGALLKALPAFRLGVGGKMGSGTQFWSWISLEDCCRAIVLFKDNAQAIGPINLVSPNPVTNQQFTDALGAALGRPTLLPAPRWALRVALGEMADALLMASCRAKPQKLQELGFEYRHPELGSYLKSVLKN